MLWTESQQHAIDTRDKSLLVSAAAGSGKTAILIERIVKIVVEDKVDVDRLLVVTFTKAAAEEMRVRLYKKLIEARDGAQRSFLNRQIAKLPGASISTLHSFCLDVVKKYFQVIDVDPALRIGDETQIGILKDRALDELLEEEYEKEDRRFMDLLGMFNNRRDEEEIRGIINKIHLFLMNRPFPQTWTKNALELFKMTGEEFDESNYYKQFQRSVEKKLDSAKYEIREAIRLLSTIAENDKAVAILQDESDQLDLLIRDLGCGYSAYYKTLTQAKFSTLRIKTDQAELKEVIVDYRNSAKDIVRKLQENVQYNPPESMMEDIGEMEPVMGYLMDMVFRYEEIFHGKKIERRLMDFNDIEHYTLQILQDAEVRLELNKQYEFIFVDEYQDSNEIQDTIISSFMREDNVFFVGDVKQSIYRFRMADPTLFIEKQKLFSKGGQEGKEAVSLNKNFRSREKIIDFINLIFESVMSEYIGEVNYDEEAKLYLGANHPPLEENVEITIIDNDKENISSEELMEVSKIEGEALYISSKIKELKKEEIYDDDLEDYRPIEYKDMVILLRTTRQWSDAYYQVLNNQGIPVYAESQTGYFDTLEIRLIVQLLKLIDNSYQDIPLLSVMRSPIFSFTIEELTTIRIEERDAYFFDAIKTYTVNHDDDLSRRLGEMIDQIKLWKRQCRYMPLNDFIWQLVVDTGYYYYISAMPGGTQRQANVRILVDRAKQYSESSISGLFNFIQLIEGLSETKRDLSSAKVIGPNENVVRIMSIHKSKGLEFPVVFVGGVGKNMNLQDLRDPIITHKDLGICPNYVNLEERRYCPTIFKTIAKEKLQLETLSEEMRVLYVALSRAKDHLYLVGTVNKLESAMAKRWAKTISDYSVSTARSYLDWIMPVLLGDRGRSEGERPCYKLKYESLSAIISRVKTEQVEGKWDLIRHLENLKVEKPDEIYETIQSKLSWVYPYKKESYMPTKASVTQLKDEQMREEVNRIPIADSFNVPKFQKKKEMTGSQRGTILHFILQHMDLGKLKAQKGDLTAEINRQVEDMIERELLNEEEVDNLFAEKIAGYFKNQLGQSMLKASKVYREKAFNYKASVENSSDYVLVQGIIDCYFTEGQNYILVDYKSDYYGSEGDKKQIIENYTPQLSLYKKAIEKLTKKDVIATYIYLFYKGEAVEVELT